MNEMKQRFANNLRRIMGERRISMTKLAAKMDVPVQSVCMWCMGKYTPRLDSVYMLRDALDCSFDDLMM